MNRMQTMAIVFTLATGAHAASLQLGDTLPARDVPMKNVDGKTLTIADAKGRHGTLVIFSCNHCPFVKAWETRIAAVGNAALAKGVGVIQINANDPAVQPADGYQEMQQRARERGFQFPYVVDATSDVARAFGAGHTPECFLFDAADKLVYRGAVDDDKDAAKVTQHWLRDAVDALAAGREIATKETKAIGCTIKFRKKS